MSKKYLVIILIATSGCTKIYHDNKIEFRLKEFDLIDTETDNWFPFTKISMLVPEIFDTLMTWTVQMSDCCGFYSYYRFTNKNYCLIPDEPMYGKHCINNYYYLTIRHHHKSNLNQYSNLKYFTDEMNMSNYKKSLDLYTPLINWRNISLVNIKNRDWYIARGFVYECDVSYTRELLFAKTLLNNRWINFDLECKLDSCFSFDSVASKIIYSVNFISTKNK